MGKKLSLMQMLRLHYLAKKYDHYAYIFDTTGSKVAEYEWSYYLKVRNEYYKEMRGY
jgi:hypothetical protein